MIHDGTAWDESLPLSLSLKARAEWGRGYSNERLEAKRRTAIDWLRTHKGWVCDKILHLKKPSA
jgi:hypothetical protein